MRVAGVTGLRRGRDLFLGTGNAEDRVQLGQLPLAALGTLEPEAVARAHHRTGLPIMLHSYSPGQVGRQQTADSTRQSGYPRPIP